MPEERETGLRSGGSDSSRRRLKSDAGYVDGAVMNHMEVASQALTKALNFQSPVARKNLERLRRVHPDATPAELAKRVTRYYLSMVTTSGGAMGAAGAIPGGGIPSAAFDVVAFTEASVL